MHEQELELFRATRARTLSLVRSLAQEQLDWRPAPDRWSVGEVLDHLILAEGLGRGQIADLVALARAGKRPVIHRSLRQSDLSILFIPVSVLALAELPISIFSRLLPQSLRDLVTRSRLIPLQNPAAATPQRGRPGEALRSGLRAALAETSALLAANADLDYREMRVENALLGVNDVPGILRFLALHEQRHQQQICDVLLSDGFPATV